MVWMWSLEVRLHGNKVIEVMQKDESSIIAALRPRQPLENALLHRAASYSGSGGETRRTQWQKKAEFTLKWIHLEDKGE